MRIISGVPNLNAMATNRWSVGAILVGRRSDRRTLDELEAALFLDREDAVYKFQRFGLLLVLSAIIASGGIVADSTATVIGAMIVAPLGIPIMGVALATVVGSARRLSMAVLGVLVGAAAAALIGAIMSVFIPNGTDLLTNSQVAGRITPSVVDMVVALAVGLVAAVGMMRKDLSDVLPGVAIAISLVPPMCVVGITAAEGYWGASLGALILFATNVIAMVTAGIATFGLAQYAKSADLPDLNQRRIAGVVVAALLVLLIPLSVQTVEYIRLTQAQTAAVAATDDWIAGTGWTVKTVEVTRNQIAVEILGTGQPPDPQTLRSLLNQDVGMDIPLVLDVHQGEQLELS